ncbi:MAG: RNA-splicing ligase RtcB [Chitinophagales bacterium]|nr:MAG: RNA-splicing ligase RtcB [Chitinophagales bacterium]
MFPKHQLVKVSDFLWEIPLGTRPDMRVPAHIYALEEMIDSLTADRSLQQLLNITTLPGIRKAALVMPDAHEGYGFPIGGIAATSYPQGVISPGGIGYDINCGVRLLVSDLFYEDAKDHLEDLSKELYRCVPSGVGRGGNIKLSAEELDKVLKQGASWAVSRGMGSPEDLQFTESGGCLQEADPACVSANAKKRGHDQLGTIGAGNHFVEVERVDKIFDEDIAAAFGLKKNQLTVLIHTGSRGLGHQVATDYLRIMATSMPGYHIKLPDRELACVPFNSPEGQNYFHAMCAAANFAWCNRQVISDEIRTAWRSILGKSARLRILYDVAHNIAKVEEHPVNGHKEKLIVHRKGATRAFGPYHPELPEPYQSVGQPVLIPGSMGTASYVLAGTAASMQLSFGSTCHGAGRRLSRTTARKTVHPGELIQQLKEKGIHLQAGSKKGVAEEAPAAYKDVDLVVETVHRAGIAQKVARLIPVAVIKG